MKTLARKADDEIKSILFEPAITNKINGNYRTFPIKTYYDEFFQLWKESVAFREYYKEIKDESSGEITYEIPTLFAFITVSRAGRTSDEKVREIKKDSEFCKIIYPDFRENAAFNGNITLDDVIFNKEGSFDVDSIKNLNKYTLFHLKDEIENKFLESVNNLISNKELFGKELTDTKKMDILKICLKLDPRLVSLYSENFNSTINPKVILDLANNTTFKPNEMTKEAFENKAFNFKVNLYFLQSLGFDIMALIRRDQEGLLDEFRYLDIDSFQVERSNGIENNDYEYSIEHNSQTYENRNVSYGSYRMDSLRSSILSIIFGLLFINIAPIIVGKFLLAPESASGSIVEASGLILEVTQGLFSMIKGLTVILNVAGIARISMLGIQYMMGAGMD